MIDDPARTPRRKTPLACQHCRLKKIKCDGVHPGRSPLDQAKMTLYTDMSEFAVHVPEKVGERTSVYIDISRKRMAAYQRGKSRSPILYHVLFCAGGCCRQPTPQPYGKVTSPDVDMTTRLVSYGNCRTVFRALNSTKINPHLQLGGPRHHQRSNTKGRSTLTIPSAP